MPKDKERASFVTPILANKDFGAPSVFEPENLPREVRRQKRLSTANVPEICIFDPDGDIVRALRRAGRVRRADNWAFYHTELDEFAHEDERFGIIGCAVGASFAVLVAYELFASGCRLLLSMTSAGQITESGPLPYFILIDRALRDEDTSYHYSPPAPFAEADPAFADRVMAGFEAVDLPVYRGAVWTTDAPFCETAAAIAAAHARGLPAVEMEAAALYTFAEARRKPILCFAHVTNQMAISEGDFEKGEADVAFASLRLLAAAARAWRVTSGDSSQQQPAPPPDQAALFGRLSALGIATTTVDYPAHRTVEEGRALRGAMSGCFTKNLLLRDKKGRLFLVVAHEERSVDLRTLHEQVGASGRPLRMRIHRFIAPPASINCRNCRLRACENKID